MVAFVVAHLFEVHGAPFELAQVVVEVTVHRAGVDDRHARFEQRLLVVRLGFVEEVGVERDFDARVSDHLLEPCGVAIGGQALPRVFEVAVVVVEAHRQALDDARRQFARVGLPLLGGVVLDERLVQRAPDERNALVVEIRRIGARELTGLLLDQRLGFGGRVVRAEELVDRAQIDRQRVDLAIMRGIDAVHIIGERRETVHVIPHALVGRVEQVCAVFVDFGAGLRIHI